MQSDAISSSDVWPERPPNAAANSQDFDRGNREMNFREVAATILAAIVLGVAFWATIGPPPREEHFSMVSKRQLERAFEP